MRSMTKNELLEIARAEGIPANAKMRKSEILKAVEDGIKYSKMPNDYLETRKAIASDLFDQLERNGTYGEFYIDLVNDYMAMWDIKNKLILDIDEKGVSVRYQHGAGQFGYKKNDSVAELQRTNNQMLRLLDHLGLKPSNQEGGEYDPGDLEM